MRFIIECWIPAKIGNCSMLDGTMSMKIKKYLDAVKPEAYTSRLRMVNGR